MIYATTWRNKYIGVEAQTLQEMAAKMRDAAAKLEQMAKDGVKLDGGQEDDYCRLVTHDPMVAAKYDMQPESDEF